MYVCVYSRGVHGKSGISGIINILFEKTALSHTFCFSHRWEKWENDYLIQFVRDKNGTQRYGTLDTIIFPTHYEEKER